MPVIDCLLLEAALLHDYSSLPQMHKPSGTSSQRDVSSYRQSTLILWHADILELQIHIAKVRGLLTHSVSGEGCRQQAIRVVVAPQRWSQPKNACRNQHTRLGNRLTTLHIYALNPSSAMSWTTHTRQEQTLQLCSGTGYTVKWQAQLLC